jgi:hypothetical protein
MGNERNQRKHRLWVQAEDECDVLRAEVERLREALQDIADWVFPDSDPMVVREFARAALSLNGGDQDGH